MSIEQIITLAKERLGKDITEQEAQDYINGKTAIPDEALDIISGGGDCALKGHCPVCLQLLSIGPYGYPYCNNPNCSQYHLVK